MHRNPIRWPSRWLVRLALPVALSTLAQPGAFAQYDITKTITVDAKTVVHQSDKTYYQYAAHVFAGDKHDPKKFHEDTKGNFGNPIPRELTVQLLEADTAHGKPDKSKHLKLTDPTKFDQSTKLENAGVALHQASTHADSTANVDISTVILSKTALKGIIHIKGQYGQEELLKRSIPSHQ